MASEELQDAVGAMVTNNAETGVRATYNDTSGKIDFSTVLGTSLVEVTPNMTAAQINAAIAASPVGATILFAEGDYVLNAKILYKANRCYIGASGNRSTRLMQANNTELDYLMDVDPSEASPRTGIYMSGLFLDGNRANNTNYVGGGSFANNNGLRLYNVLDSTFDRMVIRHCGRDGVVFDGSGEDYDHTSATNHFIDLWAYDNGRYGVTFKVASQDNHISGSDIGYNEFGCVLFLSGSNTITDSALWGTKQSHGVTVGASVNILRDCQIEGNAQHGVFITEYGNHTFLLGSKIYSNGDNSGNYDGVYVQGTSGNPVEGTVIVGNSFLAALYFGGSGPAPVYRHAITLDTYTEATTVDANQSWAIAADGAWTTTVLPVFGLKAGDALNGHRWVNAAGRPTYAQPGDLIYVKDTGNLEKYSEYRSAWERMLSHTYDVIGGTIAVSSGWTSATVTFAVDRFDTSYTPIIALDWNTTWWISALSSTGFTVSFGTAPGSAQTMRRGLVRH